jgi:hypothetical protein
MCGVVLYRGVDGKVSMGHVCSTGYFLVFIFGGEGLMKWESFIIERQSRSLSLSLTDSLSLFLWLTDYLFLNFISIQGALLALETYVIIAKPSEVDNIQKLNKK